MPFAFPGQAIVGRNGRRMVVGAAAGGVPAQTLGVVASSRGQVPTNVTGLSVPFTSRRRHYTSTQGSVTNHRFVDVGFYDSAGVIATIAGYTIKRYLEYPAGVFTQVTWAGATTKVITTSSVNVSDPVALPIPPNTEWWSRTVVTATSGNVPCIVTPAGSAALGLGDGNAAADQGNSGTIAATSGVNTIGATCVLGDISAANARSFFLGGDSINFGEGDVSNVSAKGDSGYVARLVGINYPYLKYGVPGQTAQQAATALATTQMQSLFAAINFKDALTEWGVNDLRTGRTLAQILADYQTIYAGRLAGKRIYQMTITPRSSSSNSYADAAGQAPRTDGNMADLTPLNTAIRAGLANVTAFIDAADAAMSARDSNIWGPPYPPTTDGTHPNSAKANAMSAALAIPGV